MIKNSFLLSLIVIGSLCIISTRHVKLGRQHGHVKEVKHTGLFPQMPPFIVYCTQNDYAWALFSDCIFNIFDLSQDEVIEPGEWIDTVSGITGSQTIGDWSLVIYYGIVAGTLEWKLQIYQDDWTDFMSLVRDYLKEDIYQNPQANSANSSTTNSSTTNSSTTNTLITLNVQDLRRNIIATGCKGFLTQFRQEPQLKLKHQALGSYLCNSPQNWNLIVEFLFNLLDVDHDQFIQESEFINVSSQLGLVIPFNNYWSYMDTDKDGKLNRTEWAEAMEYGKIFIEPQLNKIIPNMDFMQLLEAIF